MPGCGLGIYAVLLVGLGVAGVVGVIVASLALLQGDGTSPGELMAGRSVQTWRLAPMVEAGVLPPGEVPEAWHDESLLGDGGRACALLQDAVVRVEDGQGLRVPFTDIQDVSLVEGPDGSEVVSVDGASTDLACLFRPGEGGGRFLRQIEAERLQRQRGQ